MHERSLVKALIDQVFEEAQARHLGRIHEIQIEVGEFSGVEPSLVESAFAEMALDYWDQPVRLEMTVAPLTAACRACGSTFRIERFVFRCSQCDSGELRVTSGEEIRLVSLRAERPASVDGMLEDARDLPNATSDTADQMSRV